LQNSVTKVQEEQKDNILFLSTMTLSAGNDGLRKLSEFLKDGKRWEAYQAHLSLWNLLDETETSSVTNSLNGYTISSFAVGNDYYLAISRKRVPGLRERLTKTVTTKAKSIFSKHAIWLIVLAYLTILAVSTSLMLE